MFYIKNIFLTHIDVDIALAVYLIWLNDIMILRWDIKVMIYSIYY